MRTIQLLALALAACAILPAQAAFRLYPPNPVQGEEFVLQTFGSIGNQPVEVLAANFAFAPPRLTATHLTTNVNVSPTSRTWASQLVPGLPTGTWQLWLKTNESPDEIGLGPITIGTGLALQVPRFRGLDANFYDPAESGWGVNMIEGRLRDTLFAIWLDHGNPFTATDVAFAPGTWLVMPNGRWISPTVFRGVLYETEGPSVDREYSNIRTTPRGYATFTFLSADEVDFQATLGFGPQFREVTRTKRLRRQAF